MPSRGAVAAAALLAVILGELVSRYGGGAPAADIAWTGLVVFLVLEAPEIGRTGQLMSAAAVFLGAGLWLTGQVDAQTIARGLESGSFFALFVGVLGFLRMPAMRSRTVAACGQVLTNLPPGRRTVGLTVGTHVLGNLLNMSSLALLGSMIGERGSADDRRRMLLACHRGFAAVPLWSPFAMTIALVLSLFPALSWSRYAGIGLTLAVTMMGLGWMFDRFGSVPATAERQDTPAPLPVFRPFLRLGLLITMLTGVIFALSMLGNVTLILAVLTCVPVFALAWSMVHAVKSRPRDIPLALMRDVRHALPALRNEVATLAAAAFIGVLAAELIDAASIRDAFTALGLGPAAMIAAVPWVVTGGAVVGISPIVGIMVLGQVLASLPAPHPPETAMAAALTVGWACAVSVSPFTALVLIVGRLADGAPWTVGLRWNGPFTVAALTILSALVYAIAVLG